MPYIYPVGRRIRGPVRLGDYGRYRRRRPGYARNRATAMHMRTYARRYSHANRMYRLVRSYNTRFTRRRFRRF